MFSIVFRRALALFASLALLVAACSDDDVIELGGEDAGESGDGAAAGADATSGGGGSGSDGSGDASTAAGASLDPNGAVGSLGPALLRPDVADAVVEIDRSEGRDLSDDAVDAIRGELERSGGKSVSFGGSDTLPSREVWSTAQLREVAAQHRETGTGDGQVSIHVLVVSGRHEDEGAVGIAFDASSFAVFVDQLEPGLLGGLTASSIEEAVAVHELGHLFGLVNLTGHGAFHEDPEHPGHSASQDSVMHWAVERGIVTEVFEGGPPTEFDEADRDEMERIRAAG